MPNTIDQSVPGSGNAFSGSGDVYVTHHHYAPGSAPPSPSPPLSAKFDLSRLPKTDSSLFGRDDELDKIDYAWQDEDTNVLVLTAMGGAGKTALMQKWIDDKRYCGADAVYTWSFYSQGSSEDRQASTTEFFDNALAWFGHDGSPIRSERELGVQLAELVCRQRTLLVLDGLEPLQYPLGGAMNGALKDKGIISLCKQLAAKNNGLLLISSRQPVMELDGKPHLLPHELEPLSEEAGLALFRHAGIKGEDAEITNTVKAYGGHALSLSLLASYLTEYEHGHILNQYTLRELTEFPEETYGSRHAFKVMAGHERKLLGRPELQILFCMGLFDRPVSVGAMSCLRKEGIIGLPSDERVFRVACERLRKQGLLNQENKEHPGNLDTHPLVRQYFGRRLAELHPESWRQAHLRLYEYFKALPEKKLPDTLEEMEPLFAAVRHGCAAGMHQQVKDEVYGPRIRRGKKNYLCKKLGAFSADIAVLANFFTVPWSVPASGLTEIDQASVLNFAAYRLRGLGQLNEAIKLVQSALSMRCKQERWKDAATNAALLSSLQRQIGNLKDSLKTAQDGVKYADKSDDLSERIARRATLADVLHQQGEWEAAHILYSETEQLHLKRKEAHCVVLPSAHGARYCDLLLAKDDWRETKRRAALALEWAEDNNKTLLDKGLNKLVLGRSALQEAINQTGMLTAPASLPIGFAIDFSCISLLPSTAISPSNTCINEIMQEAKRQLEQAVDDLRAIEREDYLPRGLLARAAWGRWAAVLLAQPAHCAAAERDLQECEEIAQRGGMQLHLIDCHLEAARLARASGKDVLGLTAEEHLAAAQDGIIKTGYKRRLVEVEQVAEVVRA